MFPLLFITSWSRADVLTCFGYYYYYYWDTFFLFLEGNQERERAVLKPKTCHAGGCGKIRLDGDYVWTEWKLFPVSLRQQCPPNAQSILMNKMKTLWGCVSPFLVGSKSVKGPLGLMWWHFPVIACSLVRLKLFFFCPTNNDTVICWAAYSLHFA